MEWDGNDGLDDEDVERTGRRRSLVLSSPYPARRLSILSTPACHSMTVSEKWAVLRRPSTVSVVSAAPKLNDGQRHSSISSIITKWSFGGLDISSQRPQTAATSVVLGEMDANSVDKTEIPHLVENAFFSNIIL